MSPTLNGSSEIQGFKHSDAIEICDGTILDFLNPILFLKCHCLSSIHNYPWVGTELYFVKLDSTYGLSTHTVSSVGRMHLLMEVHVPVI